ncbi:hypothetical protein AVL59_15410 [Streptomyces griseochromogenes]|uniref:Carrier domain-containing protein n=1 Tax=Streptomyces griseochromogenes TaxID=68214 RepID=A0A1B1AWA4_9ACTN|nr:hypothetical protein AVL59_15410 [Streptomyces griseochromogenes]
MFEDQVERTPHQVAVRDATSELSYAALNHRANRFAHHLIGAGIGPESLVAVTVVPSARLVVALLGVLKSGAAYIPIDADHPRARIAALLSEAEPSLVLTDVRPPEPYHPVPVSTVSELTSAAAAQPHTNPRHRIRPENAAYVIFTSGSTGRPKGVIVEHRALSLYLDYARTMYPGVSDGTFLHSSLSFDLTVTSLFGTLVAGGLLRVRDLIRQAPDPSRPAERPAFLKATPSHLPLLLRLPAAYAPTDQLVVGGEQLTGALVDHWRKARPGVTVINEYGPTEATVGCCVYRLEPEDPVPAGNVPIGRATWETRLHVLDDRLTPVPYGRTGELYIAGGQLARGYLANPGLTAERFVADPFGPPGTRMYRTGDLARWSPDGELEFLGRVDDQVKVRGHRIELGEIEAVLGRHPDVTQAVVVVREDEPGLEQLVAYVLVDGEACAPEALHSHACRFLPDYMRPSAYMCLPALPLTANGKVDRRALPPPPDDTTVVPDEPGSGREETLRAIFGKLLGKPGVSLDDDFFASGGNSVAAAALADLARRRGLLLSLRDVFERRTPRTLAALLESRDPAGPPASSTMGHTGVVRRHPQ